MAILALGTKAGPVRVVLAADPMTVIAAFRRAFDRAVEMAGRAGHCQMPAFKGKRSRFVESNRSGPAGRGVARGAGILQEAAMGVAMAGLAILLGRGGRSAWPRALKAGRFGCVAFGAADLDVFARQEEFRLGVFGRLVAVGALDAQRLVAYGGLGPSRGSISGPKMTLVAGRGFMDSSDGEAGLVV